MSYFIIKCTMNDSHTFDDVGGFQLMSNTSKEEIEQDIEKFFEYYDENCDDDGEFPYTDSMDTIDPFTRDDIEVQQLSEQEYNTILNTVGSSSGLTIYDFI